MKKCAVVLVIASFAFGGCLGFIPKHPEKSKNEYYADKAFCEKEARNYAMERLEPVGRDDEINHTRRCMKELGWEYSLFSKGSDADKTDEGRADETQSDEARESGETAEE